MLCNCNRRLAQHFVNNFWAIFSTVPFYGIKVRAEMLQKQCVQYTSRQRLDWDLGLKQLCSGA